MEVMSWKGVEIFYWVNIDILMSYLVVSGDKACEVICYTCMKCVFRGVRDSLVEMRLAQ